MSDATKKVVADRVAEAIISRGDQGVTTDELADLIGEIKGSITPRLKPLREKGMVCRRIDPKTGKPIKRTAKSGARQTVWFASNGSSQDDGGMPGMRVYLANGEKFLDFYKRISSGPGKKEDKIKAARIAPVSYRYIEDIVLLAGRNDLSAEEQAQCAEALALLERTGQPGAAYRLVKPIAARVWPRTDRRIEHFMDSLRVIEQMAQCSKDVEVPPLDPERRENAMKRVSDSIKLLQNLKGKITKNWEA